MSYKNRIESILQELSQGVYEREEALKLVLLSFLSGKSAFLYGPPGTAKSLIARRVSLAFDIVDSTDKTHAFFPYLMNRFSTPEEIFGPIDIAALRANKLTRSTQGYLPTAHFAFLDEIWKSSPAILNTLLTIINEKIYRDGNTDTKVPLKGLVCASNEFPTPNQGLEALYDRLVVRLSVLPMKQKESFEALLQTDSTEPHITSPITLQELDEIAKAARKVQFSQEALEAIHSLKSLIEAHNAALKHTIPLENTAPTDEKPESSIDPLVDSRADSSPDAHAEHYGIYVSDRRWKSMAELLKTAAHLSDRDEVLPIDLMLLAHCLWSDETHKPTIRSLLSKALKQSLHDNTQDGDIDNIQQEYSKHYDATIAEFYENGTPKQVTPTTKELYNNKCRNILESIITLRDNLQEIFTNTQDTMANPFLSEDDYHTALQGIKQSQDELKQLSLAITQLKHIIDKQPTPVPPKYGEAATQAPTQTHKAYKPAHIDELRTLVKDESISLGDIDTSAITDMSHLFENSTRTDFSGISEWDVSNVIDMENMFKSASYFNEPLNSWNVSNVKSMECMFYGASSFDQPLYSWDVSNVENMRLMFRYASAFDQSLETWNVGNVNASHLADMFEGTAMQRKPKWCKSIWY